MKKFGVLFLCAIMLFCASAPAESLFDPSGYTDAQLYDILDIINAELASRGQALISASLNPASFYTAEIGMARYIEYDRFEKTSADGSRKINEDFYVHTDSGIRLLEYKGRIVKVSALADEGNDEDVLRMYLVAAIIEGGLSEMSSVSDSAKKAAFGKADEIVNDALGFYVENYKTAAVGREDGYRGLAGIGAHQWYWECTDGFVWLSCELAPLPDGIR